MYVSRHVQFLEFEFPYIALTSSTFSLSSHTSPTTFSIPLTDFSDISVSVSIPSSTSPSVNISPTSPSVNVSPSSHFNPSSLTPSSDIPSLTTLHSDIPFYDQPTTSVIPSSFPASTSSNIHPMVTRSKHGITKPKTQFGLTVVDPISSPVTVEPSYFSEAIKHTVWQQAMSEEFTALVKSRTWTLVPPPPNTNIIGCQWIYKIKRNSDGSIARYKARLVANGNQQYEGIDFSETFSPVPKQPTLRVVLTLADD